MGLLISSALVEHVTDLCDSVYSLLTLRIVDNDLVTPVCCPLCVRRSFQRISQQYCAHRLCDVFFCALLGVIFIPPWTNLPDT